MVVFEYAFATIEFSEVPYIQNMYLDELYFLCDILDFLEGKQELYSNFWHKLEPNMQYRLWTCLGANFCNNDIVLMKYIFHFERAISEKYGHRVCRGYLSIIFSLNYASFSVSHLLSFCRHFSVSANVYQERLSFRHLFGIWSRIFACLLFALGHTTWKGKWRWILLFLWFVFLPIRFYILTDFVHLPRFPGVIYFDIVYIAAMAFAGMVSGFASMELIHKEWNTKYHKHLSWFYMTIVVIISMIGVYMGRFLRFNSWDILHNPMHLLRETWLLEFKLRNMGYCKSLT